MIDLVGRVEGGRGSGAALIVDEAVANWIVHERIAVAVRSAAMFRRELAGVVVGPSDSVVDFAVTVVKGTDDAVIAPEVVQIGAVGVGMTTLFRSRQALVYVFEKTLLDNAPSEHPTEK